MKKLLLLVCCCLPALQVSAQATALDPAFGTGGVANFAVTGTNPVHAVAIYPNGKIIGAGIRNTAAGADFMLVKCSGSGVADANFGTGGVVTYDFNSASNDEIKAMVLQPDGKIIAAGRSDASGAYGFALARFDSLGVPDPSFGTNGTVTTALGTSSCINAIKTQADGKIVVAGFASVNSNTEFALARYNTDGSLDNTFATAGIFTGGFDLSSSDSFAALSIQNDGKIIVAGTSTSNQVGNRWVVMRFDNNGILDNTFGNNGMITDSISMFTTELNLAAMTLQPDGKIVVGGRSGITYYSLVLARYNTNGLLDPSFNGTGRLETRFTTNSASQGRLYALGIAADGKIIAAGYSSTYGLGALALMRMHPSGLVDSSFGVNGRVFNDIGFPPQNNAPRILSLAIQTDGKIVAGTAHYFTGSLMVRYLMNGTGGVPLPVQINNFKAQLDKGTGKLTWSIATDMDVHNINIEKSADGISFAVIGSVPGKQEANTEEQYTFFDRHLLSGSNYYRLKIISKDGKITYSNIEVLNFGSPENYFVVYPNPASSNDLLTMLVHTNNAESSMVRIIDVNGRIVIEQRMKLQKGDNRISITDAKLNKGNYLIQVCHEDGSMLDKAKMLIIQ